MAQQPEPNDEDLRTRLQRLAAGGGVRPLDWHFARWMAELGTDEASANASSSDDIDGLVAGAWLVSRQAGEGDVCVDLSRWAGRELPEVAMAAPSLDRWRRQLLRSSVVGEPGAFTPLVLDDERRLYLHRFHRAESTLAAALTERARRQPDGIDLAHLSDGLERLFPTAIDAADSDQQPDQEPDWQRVAAALAVLRGFVVVSGGPGTGKTHTVAAILDLLRQQSTGREPRIGLAAPTGKAAARLTESIRQARRRLPAGAGAGGDGGDGGDGQGAVLEAVTLHRLLGIMPGRNQPRYGPNNPLHLDLLVVDEASMVDLTMMAWVVAALPPTARLILLGDRDQLASVEAGSVLGDICGGGRAPLVSPGLAATLADLGMAGVPVGDASQPAIADSIALLRRSYRFGPDSGIGALATAIKAADPATVQALLRDPELADVAALNPGVEALDAAVASAVLPHWRGILATHDPVAALAALGRFRVLCAVRKGPWGVEQINRRIEQGLRGLGVISGNGLWYAGRPIMVTRNDPGVGLSNGDVGLLLPHPDSRTNQSPDEAQRLWAWFEGPDGEPRAVATARLPPHESVYAMTVHKSQGSEFDQVLVVLPGEDVPVLSRELVYTAITRARERVLVWGPSAVLEAAIERRVERSGGLLGKLWGGD